MQRVELVAESHLSQSETKPLTVKVTNSLLAVALGSPL